MRVLQQAANDDPEAQAELFRTYSTQLYRAAYSVLRNREDAEDALQNCWLSALINLRSFEGRSSLSTWLTRILINSALMILRKKRKGGELSLDAMDDAVKVSLRVALPKPVPDPEQSLLENEKRKILGRAVCELRPRLRAALDLAEFRELSVRETAESLGISLAAAKARLFHARAALRRSAVLQAIAKTTTVATAHPSAKVNPFAETIGTANYHHARNSFLLGPLADTGVHSSCGQAIASSGEVPREVLSRNRRKQCYLRDLHRLHP